MSRSSKTCGTPYCKRPSSRARQCDPCSHSEQKLDISKKNTGRQPVIRIIPVLLVSDHFPTYKPSTSGSFWHWIWAVTSDQFDPVSILINLGRGKWSTMGEFKNSLRLSHTHIARQVPVQIPSIRSLIFEIVNIQFYHWCGCHAQNPTIYLSIYLSVCLSVDLSIYLSIYLYIYIYPPSIAHRNSISPFPLLQVVIQRRGRRSWRHRARLALPRGGSGAACWVHHGRIVIFSLGKNWSWALKNIEYIYIHGNDPVALGDLLMLSQSGWVLGTVDTIC